MKTSGGADSFEKRTGRDRYFAALDREIAELLDPATGMLSAEYSLHVPCGVCGADCPERIFVKRGYTFVRCLACGHIYSNPQVKASVVAETYAHSEANELWTEVLLSPANQEWQIPYFEEALDIIERHADRGTALDVGCSIGLFMEVAVARGWSAVGLELGERAAAHALSRGLDVRRRFLHEADLEPASLDAITAFSLMEHLNDPNELVAQARGLLKPGGVFMAISPNAYSLASMMLREKMPTFDGRNHLQYYTPDSLRLLFERNGFEVVHLDTVLSALDNIRRYVDYQDPHGDAPLTTFPPPHVQALLAGDRRGEVEDFLSANDLGLRLRILARRPG